MMEKDIDRYIHLHVNGRIREDQIREDSNSGGDSDEENEESDDQVDSDVENELGTGEEKVKTNKKPGPYDKLNEDLDGLNKFEKVSSSISNGKMEQDVSSDNKQDEETLCGAEDRNEEVNNEEESLNGSKKEDELLDKNSLGDDNKQNDGCGKDSAYCEADKAQEKLTKMEFLGGRYLVPKLIVFTLAACLLVYLKFATMNKLIRNYGKTHNFHHPDYFVSKIGKVLNDFPNLQRSDYWSVLKKGGQRHLMKVWSDDGSFKSTRKNQIYLLAGYANSEETVSCFVKKLSETLVTEQFDNSRVLDGSKFEGVSALIDEMDSLISGSRKLLVLKDIDKFTFSLENLLLSFHYAYPHSILILTAKLPFLYDSARSHNDNKRLAELYFKEKVWWDHFVLIKKEEDNACFKGSVKEEL